MSDWTWRNFKNNVHWDDFWFGTWVASIIWMCLAIALMALIAPKPHHVRYIIFPNLPPGVYDCEVDRTEVRNCYLQGNKGEVTK